MLQVNGMYPRLYTHAVDLFMRDVASILLRGTEDRLRQRKDKGDATAIAYRGARMRCREAGTAEKESPPLPTPDDDR